eukprot:CAMPEP_0170636062 /NCGR_PEP_ID=MMETSP0224-20130122/37580_1 /TAXON_ID=285029 /ORGANISM="Togula jolla, Strain CCCM 725" /LENGTH=191 /DNA_ID=CAMNT_0010965655 /DNA_START=30 /DNA_END=601 /DNA_ORIENTATION=+
MSLNEMVQGQLQQLFLEMAKRCLAEKMKKETTTGDAMVRLQRFMLQQNIATFVQERGNLSESEESLQKLHEELVVTLGDKHPMTLSCLNQLAVTLQKWGKTEEALKVHETCLLLRRLALGEEHVDTLQSLANVALTRSEMKPMTSNAWQLARESLMEAREKQEKVLGFGDARTSFTVSCLGNLLSSSLEAT